MNSKKFKKRNKVYYSAVLLGISGIALTLEPSLSSATNDSGGQAQGIRASEERLPACKPARLEDSNIYVIFNGTDKDAQVIVAGGFEDGLKEVEITGPQGIVNIDADFEDGRNIGQADFQFDTTEPSLGRLRRSYPAGHYRFLATTVSNCVLRNTLELTYKLPAVPSIIFPTEGSKGITASGFTALWEKIPRVDTVRFVIEEEESGKSLAVDLPGNATSFDIPATYLQPRILYTMDVIGITENGNRTVSDVQFTTAR